MTEIEVLDEMIRRGVVGFAMLGVATVGDRGRRHASLSLCGTTRFAQGYGDTAAEALGKAIAAIDATERPAQKQPVVEENDPLAEMLG